MIPGLEAWLRDIEPGGAPELAAAIEQIVALPGARVRLDQGETIWRARVHRLHFREECTAAGGVWTRSVVLKRLPLDRAHREQRAVRRWLPHVGLGAHGPPLLGVAARRDAAWVWHAYEDLGEPTLATPPADVEHVRAAVRLVAELHARFATSSLLGECREFGVDLGPQYLPAGLRDTRRALAALVCLPAERGGGPGGPADRLLGRLDAVCEAEPEQTRLLSACGGPETLLHGDLWTSNILVRSGPETLHVRLIDWDHAGVGSLTYDLSSLLLRFPASERAWILDCYAKGAHRLDWQLPDRETLNLLFETAETARIVNSLLWTALELLEKPAAWALERLVETESWLEALAPVLPPRVPDVEP